MTSSLPLLLACVLAGGQLETGVRTEAVGRWTDPVTIPSDAHAIDVSATPHLLLRLVGGPATVTTTYSLRLTARDLGPDQRWEHMHNGEVRFRLVPRSSWTLEAYAAAGIGRTNLVTLNRVATDVSQTTTVVTTAPIDVSLLRPGLALQVTPSARHRLQLTVEGSVSGGANASARAVLPTDREASARAEYEYDATHLDILGLVIGAQVDRFPDQDVTSSWTSALVGWRRRLSPMVDLGVRAGALELTTSVPDPLGDGAHTVRRKLDPAAELTAIAATGPEGVSARLDAKLGAAADRISGEASQNLESALFFRWPLSRDTAVHARGAASAAWPRAGRILHGGLDAGVSFALMSRVALDLGAYGAWQRSSNPAAPSMTEYGLLVGISLDAPPLVWGRSAPAAQVPGNLDRAGPRRGGTEDAPSETRR